MKAALSFLRDTITGGILFLIPSVLLIVVVRKAILILAKIASPLSERMPELIAGLDGSRIVALILLVVICFVSGLTFRLSRVRRKIIGLEEKLLSYLPGYSMLKAIATDTLGRKDDHNMLTVLIAEGDAWQIGFLVERDGDLCTVFIPEAPNNNSGEIKILPSDSVKQVQVASNKAARVVRQYGKGASAWLKNFNSTQTRAKRHIK